MIDKIGPSEKFLEEYRTFNDTKKASFSKIINRLLNESFLIRDKEEDKDDYYKALDLIDTINDYLLVMDYEVIYDKNINIIYLKSLENKNRIHLMKFETIILLILRVLYFKETKKASLTNLISVSFDELKQEVKKTNIYKEEKTTNEYLEALKKLRKLKIINFKVGNDFDGESRIFVYPSILYIVKVEDVENLNELIKKYQGENKDEEINED